jgi:sugar transferase (PEP-CTERM/EpsH1 system associated)
MDELLFLTHRIPYPPNKGDKIRSFNLLKHLTQDYRVHLGAFIDDADDWRHTDAVRGMCGDTCFVSLRPALARLGSLRGLVTGEALSLPYYRSARLQRWVDAILERGTVRHVLVFSSVMGQYLDDRLFAHARCVMDFVDMDSDKWCQYGENRPWPLSWIYRREGRALFRYERRQAMRFHASVFVSEAEANLFKRLAPETADRVGFVENGVDTDYFSPERDYPRPYGAEERALVFTGAMDYWANADAVEWFARQVFPQVRAQVPQARFYIVGARPSEGVRRLGKQSGIRVTGAVRDVRPYLAHAVAAVAPLRIARGVQNKILEAMAMGRPVLGTPQAFDGIRPCAGLEPLMNEAPEAMARAAVGLLCGDARDDLGRRGRECVLRNYNWSENLRHIQRLLKDDASANPMACSTTAAGITRSMAGGTR